MQHALQDVQLQTFIESSTRNTWLHLPTISVYVRKSKRIHEGRLFACLDIANISVEPDRQQQGVFGNWFKQAELLAQQHFEAIYVESVINPVMEEFCLRHGFNRCDDNLSRNYIKQLD